ncbi:biogenesis of lysosome-related organelles complex 1 subunit 1 [Diospyros lotus]|uniref:biogenesis of lysosome-related organelles complex 1 subunit 1 n=1 Tax=Diospyros lotus TaxID=55363 RepID=UPI0022549F68|nr:biogenesis of lysosome-related organelles complex 1 subunit 1 [Diospyros lotus]
MDMPDPVEEKIRSVWLRQAALARETFPSEMGKLELGGLEASLLRLTNDHHRTSHRLREFTEQAKKDAIRSAIRVSDLLVESVNGGVQEAFTNEKQIEFEIRKLATTVMRFGKQTDQWLATSHAMNSAIKEIGDFENWMKTMEFDCKSISTAIYNIHQA